MEDVGLQDMIPQLGPGVNSPLHFSEDNNNSSTELPVVTSLVGPLERPLPKSALS